MSKELSEKLIEYLESFAKGTGDFASQQIPDVIQQYLAWQLYGSIFVAIVNLIIVIIFSVLIKLNYKKMIEEDDPLLFFMAIPIVVCFGFAIENTYNTVKVLVAPKVVLLEKAAELVSNK